MLLYYIDSLPNSNHENETIPKGSRKNQAKSAAAGFACYIFPYNVISSLTARPRKLHSLICASSAAYSRS